MFIFAIALLCGCAVAIAMHQGILLFLNLRWAKDFRVRSYYSNFLAKKRVLNPVLFAAEITGGYLKKSSITYVHKTAKIHAGALSIVEGPFNSTDPYTFAGIQVLASIAGALFFSLLFATYHPLLLAASGILGFFVPDYLLRLSAKELQHRIFRQIPDLLDLLAIIMEAGVDFSVALKKIVATEKGPLIRALASVEAEILVGKPRNEAFGAMAARFNYPPLTTVVNAITLSLRTGTSLAPALRALSDQFRVERFQMAEKKANEAPLKLMLPLVLLIFPTIFIILFGPILLSFMGTGVW